MADQIAVVDHFRHMEQELGEISDSSCDERMANVTNLDISSSSAELQNISNPAEYIENVTNGFMKEMVVRQSLDPDEDDLQINDRESDEQVEPQMTTIDEVDESQLSDMARSGGKIINAESGPEIVEPCLYYQRMIPGKILANTLTLRNHSKQSMKFTIKIDSGVNISREQAREALI